MGEPAWVAELAAVQVEVELVELARRAQHAAGLRRVCELHAVFAEVGEAWAAPAELALLTGSSKRSAGLLLAQALLLPMLPAALQALDCGLLSVEQAAIVSRVLGDVSAPVCLSVWYRLRERLVVGHDRGEVPPPGRLRALLTRWVMEADPQAAVEQDRTSRDEADVGVQRRQHGLSISTCRGCRARTRRRSWHGCGRGRLRGVLVTAGRRVGGEWMRPSICCWAATPARSRATRRKTSQVPAGSLERPVPRPTSFGAMTSTVRSRGRARPQPMIMPLQMPTGTALRPLRVRLIRLSRAVCRSGWAAVDRAAAGWLNRCGAGWTCGCWCLWVLP